MCVAAQCNLFSPGRTDFGPVPAGLPAAAPATQIDTVTIDLLPVSGRTAFAIEPSDRVPIVVTGFEPVDLLEGILMAVRQLEAGQHEVENQYARAVRPGGNRQAQEILAAVYEVCDRPWRGLGVLPQSGLRLRAAYRDLDAEDRFAVGCVAAVEPAECRSGEVLQGRIRPSECAAFGTRCTPDHPLGAPMVSSEVACAAYWNYGRLNDKPVPAMAQGEGN